MFNQYSKGRTIRYTGGTMVFLSQQTIFLSFPRPKDKFVPLWIRTRYFPPSGMKYSIGLLNFLFFFMFGENKHIFFTLPAEQTFFGKWFAPKFMSVMSCDLAPSRNSSHSDFRWSSSEKNWTCLISSAKKEVGKRWYKFDKQMCSYVDWWNPELKSSNSMPVLCVEYISVGTWCFNVRSFSPLLFPYKQQGHDRDLL